ncbi:MAG: 5-formyltetrahydrofolate cyclo-ligase, partial [Actinobacteria bacterium]|nr:5-formyltetrahydrofolate cyclo-ligase [Actinomycetota bacterium]
IDAVIVPALLVDRRGFRLGQGGGSYDRALKELLRLSPHMWSIALVYDGEVTSSDLPNEAHDIPVKAVATPELVLRFSNTKY